METAIGIDMGGTNTVIGVATSAGEVLARTSLPTSGSSVEAYCRAVAGSIRHLLRQTGIDASNLAGAGMGAPCVNCRSGIIEAATDLPWPSPIALQELMTAALEMPVAVNNDANAAALGEMLYGRAKGLTDFIVLTLGTGVGSGIVSGGKLLTGLQGFAGELGHCRVGRRDRLCSCGRHGCLQTYASASGVVLTANECRQAMGLQKTACLTALDVGRGADAGEPWALRALEITGSVLGDAAADFAAFTDPQAIFLFGGVANAFRHIEPAMRKAFEANALSLYHRVRIMPSALPQADAAILGAAALAFHPQANKQQS